MRMSDENLQEAYDAGVISGKLQRSIEEIETRIFRMKQILEEIENV